MDINLVAANVTAFLAPFMPYLVKAGQKVGARAAEEIGERFGTAAWQKAQALWEQLRPRVEEKPAAAEMARDLASSPEDEDAQAAFRLQLRKILAEDKALAADLLRLLEDEVVQRVLAERGSHVRNVVQEAEEGPTTQEVIARDKSSVENVRQVRR